MLHDTWLPLLGTFSFFTFLHILAIVRVEPVFPRAFKLSRGLSAALLTLLGLGAFIDGFPHWDEAFLYHHDRSGDWMRFGMLAVYGHLLADLAWMVVGKFRFNIQPRLDLILHHLLGVVGFGVALYLRIGYALALLTMITEILPVTTGINAWGKRIAVQGVVDAADRARLHVLAWLRLPLWIILFVLVVLVLARGQAGDLLPGYLVAAGGLVSLVVLDVYWMGKCRQRVDFY